MGEAFQEAGKEAQKEALKTGKPVKLDSEKIAEKALGMVSPGGKYEEGIPVKDEKATAEVVKTNYAGMKAEKIVEGANKGTGSAFALTNEDVKLLEKAGVEEAKDIQKLPAQMKDYKMAAGKVETMLDAAAQGKSTDVKLTDKDVKALEAVGFEGLQDKSGLTVAKPSEINNYVDYLTGKGAPDDAYGTPTRGVGLQPKTPFAYEMVGPRGEVLKGNLATVEYEALDPTNPFKTVKVYKAPAYGPQPKAESSNIADVPAPSGDSLEDFAKGTKAPLDNLVNAAKAAAHSVEVMFNPQASLKRRTLDTEGNVIKEQGAPKLEYKSEIEGDLMHLGIKAATDTAATGKTDVSSKDLEKIGQNITANPAFALGNLAFSALTFVGPGIAAKGARAASAGAKAGQAQKAIEPLVLQSRSTLPKTFENVSIDRLLYPQKYEIPSNIKVSIDADKVVNIALESGGVKYPVGRLTSKGFEMLRTEKAIPEPLPTVADIIKSIPPEGRLSVKKVSENVSPDYAVQYGKAAQKIEELAKQPPEGFLVPRSQITEYVDQIVKTGRGDIEFGKVPKAGERPSRITMGVDETLEGARKAASEKVAENIDLERLLHPTKEIKLTQPDVVKQRGLVYKPEELEGFTFYEKYIARDPVAVEYKKIPSEFGTMKNPVEYAKKAPVVLPTRQELVTTSELFKFSELRKLLSTPEGIQRFLGKLPEERIGTRPASPETFKAIQEARPDTSIYKQFIDYERMPILRNIAHQLDLGEATTRVRTGAIKTDEVTLTKEFDRAPAGKRFVEETRPAVLGERTVKTIEEEIGEELLDPQKPAGLPRLADIVKESPKYAEPSVTGAPFKWVDESNLPRFQDIVRPFRRTKQEPARELSNIEISDLWTTLEGSRNLAASDLISRIGPEFAFKGFDDVPAILKMAKQPAAAKAEPLRASDLLSRVDPEFVIKASNEYAPRVLEMAAKEHGAPFKWLDESGLPKYEDLIKLDKPSVKQSTRRLSDDEMGNLWETLEGKKEIGFARDLLTRKEQGRFAGDLTDDEITRIDHLIRKVKMFSSESVDLGKGTVNIQKAAEDAAKASKPKERRLVPKWQEETTSSARGRQETILEKPTEQPKKLSDAELKALLKKVEGSGAPSIPGLETALGFGAGAAAGLRGKKKPRLDDVYGTDAVRYPPETTESSSMITNMLDAGKLPDLMNMSSIKPLQKVNIDSMLRIGERVGVDVGSKPDLSDLTGFIVDAKIDEDFKLTTAEVFKLDSPGTTAPKFDFDAKFDFGQTFDNQPTPDTPPPIKIPTRRIPPRPDEDLWLREKPLDSGTVDPGLKLWKLLQIEDIVSGSAPGRLEDDFSTGDFESFMYGPSKKGRSRRRGR